MNAVRRCLRTVTGRLWLRGFGPACLTGLLWLVSPFLWVGWQAPGSSAIAGPFRALVGRGVFIADWGDRSPSGLGSIEWTLGIMTQRDFKTPKAGFWSSNPRKVKPHMNFDVEIHNGHVKIPLYIPTLILLLPPLVVAWRRSRRIPDHACQGCRYDLRGTQSAMCPECGRTVPRV